MRKGSVLRNGRASTACRRNRVQMIQKITSGGTHWIMRMARISMAGTFATARPLRDAFYIQYPRQVEAVSGERTFFSETAVGRGEGVPLFVKRGLIGGVWWAWFSAI